MASCQTIHMWTFSGLVGAFLDLAIAYFLLCISTIVFFTSKFLGILGLCLPCPCNGQFGNPNPNHNYCMHKLLLDLPTQKIYSVQLSAKNKFPMDSILGKVQNLDSNMKLLSNNGSGFVELEGEASCSSVSQNFVGRIENGVKEKRFDVKGKGVINKRVRGGIIRRRKGGVDCGKLSVSSIDKEQGERIGGSSVAVDFGVGDDKIQYEREAPTIMKFGERASYDFELNQPLDETKAIEKNLSFMDGQPKNTQRILEQALEEEHSARASLYLELEKERNAAASAADEAMAMILRLQEEKASVEMEARQYKRIIEEKTAYDAEEMNILKEILLRREREKYFLEKEVEVYRQMTYLGNEQLEGDVQDMIQKKRQQLDASLDLTEDPVMMLHQLSESIDKKAMLKNKRSLLVPFQGWNEDADLSKQGDLDKQYSHVSKFFNDGNQELQEKEMVFVDSYPCAQPKEGQVSETYLRSYSPSSSQEHKLLQKTIPVVGEEQGQNVKSSLCQGVETEAVKTLNKTGIDIEIDINRSSSDMTMGLPPMGRLSLPNMRRNSMSALDNERLKIESEVGWLRERLKVVQEGREKLSLPVEHQEREKLQLKLLEDITRQLREIRQLAEPGKPGHQVSLPPPSSKVLSKKKRCRSVSLGVYKSY